MHLKFQQVVQRSLSLAPVAPAQRIYELEDIRWGSQRLRASTSETVTGRLQLTKVSSLVISCVA